MTGLISKLDNLLIDEKDAFFKDKIKLVRVAQNNTVKLLQSIAKTKDINLIMTAEKAINVHELEFYSNSKPMESSLNETLNNIKATENLVKKLQTDNKQYYLVAENYTQSKNKIGGLPKDEARQFFKAQSTRFVNMSKSPLTNEKKATIDARKANIQLAGDIYIGMQKAALGIENN